MSPTLLLFTLIPALVAVTGGVVAAFRPPGRRFGSLIQHFAAGVVFAGVAVEVLPDVLHQGAVLPAVLGFAAGVALMLVIRSASRQSQDEKQSDSGLGVIIAVDVLIDGLLLGIGFTLGVEQGGLLAVALGAELLSLALSLSASQVAAGVARGRVLLTAFGVGVLFLVGTFGGYFLLGGLSGAALEALLSFAAAALLYLVTEELLVEAHEIPETPLITSSFFAGFLLLLLLDMVA